MMLLDVAMGPIYAISTGAFLAIAVVTGLIVFGAIKLIKKVIAKNDENDK